MADSTPADRSTAPYVDKSIEPTTSSAKSASISDPSENNNRDPSINNDRSDANVQDDQHEATALDGDEIKRTDTARTASTMEVVYPTGIKLVTITVSLMLTIFCVALDNTIIATAIPRITDDFNSLNDVGWYASAYFLTNCTFQLLFGKLYTFFPLKTVFLSGLAVFELGSLVCGAAPNSTALIVGRAIAGLGAGSLFSGALIISSATVPLYKRPMYIGLIAAMFGVSSVIGPLMGGAFTDRVTWRLCFYINLPIGLVTALGIAFLFTSPARHQESAAGTWARIKQFDPLGTLVFMPSIICLLLALQWGGSKYAWNDAHIIGLFVAFAVLLVTFIGIQIVSGENATVPIRIVKSTRTVPAVMLWCICLGGAFFTFIYFVPIWFQAIHGVSATQSGINTLPFLLSQVFAAITGGIFVTKTGYYTPMVIASIIFGSVGAGLLTTWTPETSTGKWIGWQIIYGAGVGFGFQQGTTIIQTVMPNKDIPIATNLVLFVQILGGSIFVSAAQNLFTNKLIENLSTVLPPNLLIQVARAGATGFYKIVPSELLPAALVAYNGALVKAFQLGLILTCLTTIGAVFMEVKNVKKAKVKNTSTSDAGGVAAVADSREPVDSKEETLETV